MVTRKLGRGLATLAGSIPAVHSAQSALDDDQTGAAVRIEQIRYERAILDFEAAIRHERDRMSAEHLENMRTILGSEAA
ncbi:MAG: hypothetical protein USCAAHI_01536 [Beijerinckiaceae bacterium]|nr:MAG: hypothetical protein USCAAHI_01536 [Beijerinckiaceae bacterium]